MKRYYAILITFVCLLGACTQESTSTKLKIEGEIVGKANSVVYLEKMTPESVSTIDSVVSDNSGKFLFEIENVDAAPSIYNIRCGQRLFPIIACAEECIKVMYEDSTSYNYKVEGSEEAVAIQEIHSMLSNGAALLAQLQRDYDAESNTSAKQQIAKEYSDKYYSIKREHIGFVATNAGKIAGLYALYQRLPNEEYLSNGTNDIIYYRMVADSIALSYPDSKYLETLNRDIKRMENVAKLQNELNEKIANPSGYLPITLPNMRGDDVSLSDIVEGSNATLVCFWLTGESNSTLNNAELRTLYEEFHDKGFEIFQIALDTSKSEWINTIQKQKLPWITLCDFKGTSSPACIAYNVTAVPSTFLIDKDGNLVGKDLFGEELKQKLNEILQ